MFTKRRSAAPQVAGPTEPKYAPAFIFPGVSTAAIHRLEDATSLLDLGGVPTGHVWSTADVAFAGRAERAD
jgi:hypothetical protein